jgi:hypothetical protein
MSVHSVIENPPIINIKYPILKPKYTTELFDIQPHTDTLYNKRKSTFQFSNLAKYGHGPPENGFKGDRNM